MRRRVGLFCAAALFVTGMASAANISINDTLANDTIIISGSQFDASPFVGGGTFAETANGQSFSGSFLANSASTGSATFYWLEGGTNLVSDILSLNWSGPGGFGADTISGTFTSDIDPNALGTVPAGCTVDTNCFVLAETGTLQEIPHPSNFPSNITFQVGSDIDPTPEPSSVVTLGSLLLLSAPILFRAIRERRSAC